MSCTTLSMNLFRRGSAYISPSTVRSVRCCCHGLLEKDIPHRFQDKAEDQFSIILFCLLSLPRQFMPHLLLQLNQFLGNNTRNACHKPEISRSKSVVPPCQTIIGGEISETYMEVSQVMGVPPIIMYLKKIFHYKPSILGYPHDYGNPHMGTAHLRASNCGLRLLWSLSRLCMGSWRWGQFSFHWHCPNIQNRLSSNIKHRNTWNKPCNYTSYHIYMYIYTIIYIYIHIY